VLRHKNNEQGEGARPAGPDHWTFENIVLDELAQLRPSMGRPLELPKDDTIPLTRWDPQPLSDVTNGELDRAGLTALCLSGGGIRSATFSLGVITALAERKRLSEIDYLSTVSGGGYIGSWLSAWCYRHIDGITGVEAALSTKTPSRPEPEEVENLRDFTSYLAPQSGLLSTDTWAGIATVARNLLLNWLLFLPLFLLLVWLPKFSVLIASDLRHQLDHPELGFPVRWWLLSAATLIYFVSIWFTTREVISQTRGPPTGGKPRPYGAGPVRFMFNGLVPAYIAAGLASIALVGLHGLDLDIPISHALGIFAGGGALLWGLAFISVSRPSEWTNLIHWELFLARLIAGAGFGAILAAGFAIMGRMHPIGDRSVVVFGLPCCFLAYVLGNTIFVGLSSRVRDHDDIREWSARSGGLFALIGLGWMVFSALVLWDLKVWPGPLILGHPHGWEAKLLDGAVTALGGISGIVGALLGSSPASSPRKGDKESAKTAIDWTRAAQFAAVIFFAVFMFELSRLFDYFMTSVAPGMWFGISSQPWDEVLKYIAIVVALAAWTSFASYFININKFSLHAFYRNRLIRAYLGASDDNRRPNAFTGFAEQDNFKISNLRTPWNPALASWHPPIIPPSFQAPFHVVNVALNLVHGKRLAWQERKASSFTVTRKSAGNPGLGYRPADMYGKEITLGTAMAISGAAVSPNMGYHSSPLLALLMTLFNVRLGWWLGNPSLNAWKRGGPAQSVWPLLMELLGLTDDTRNYVYLSDGGHFENLGLYEMVRRRCSTIVVVDAGCDPDLTFADLGNAVRKVRIDFGVEITFDAPYPPVSGAASARLGLANRPDSLAVSPYYAIGRIHYPGAASDGELIYIKAAIHGDEPEDIGSYAAANPAFPHETTADQFFSESQFESYRRLGLHIGRKVF
jgi:hypothetical protein